jgi:hypothetical protein
VFEEPGYMFKMPGTQIGKVREGTFRHASKWYFLSYERSVPHLILDLNGFEKYSTVVLEVENPQELAKSINKKIAVKK